MLHQWPSLAGICGVGVYFKAPGPLPPHAETWVVDHRDEALTVPDFCVSSGRVDVVVCMMIHYQKTELRHPRPEPSRRRGTHLRILLNTSLPLDYRNPTKLILVKDLDKTASTQEAQRHTLGVLQLVHVQVV
jgi:hypothetical protein